MKGASMKHNYVTHDGSTLTPAQIARLDELEARIGNSIDAPELPAEAWANAVRGKFYKPRKEAISIRMDMDVLDWLRLKGPGYQTEINRILREKMLAELTAPKTTR
jgi:uncharacterized protein (DUF4415 family)